MIFGETAQFSVWKFFGRDANVLARLWRRTEDADTVSKPLPLNIVANSSPEHLPLTDASNHCRKRRQKRVRVCRLYREPPSQAAIHARALLVFIQDGCPDYVGGYVPRPDLERFYRHDVCPHKGWKPQHWTAIARQLVRMTSKKTVRCSRQRLVSYRIPKP